MISLCENCAYKMLDCEGNKDIEKVTCDYFKKPMVANNMKFEKISRQQWYKDYTWCDNVGIIDKLYDDIKLPRQGSVGSAGMDFFAYEDITILPNEILEVPTGIRWVTPMSNHVLYLFPRSGSGIKGLSLVNTVGVIDESYQFADNEGHIILFLINRGSEPITIKKGKGIVQGIVSPYVICDGANDSSDRTGGFGSTDKKQKIGE